jgi:hypothetical protein
MNNNMINYNDIDDKTMFFIYGFFWGIILSFYIKNPPNNNYYIN